MRKNIWKYELSQDAVANTIEMPTDAKIVHVGVRGGAICLWAELSPDAPDRKRIFAVYKTGWDVEPGEHLGTVITPPFVWHIYERPTA